MKKNNLSKRLLIVVKKGLSIPTLPEHIIKIQSHPAIRILRVLGGSGMLLILTKAYLYFPHFFLYIFFFFSLIFNIYHYIIAFYRIKYMISIFNSDIFEVRNSPIDRLVSLGVKALWCAKGFCDAAQPVAVSIGVMVTADNILKEANMDPIFTPIIGGAINRVFPGKSELSTPRLIESKLDLMKQNSLEIADTNKVIDRLENFKDCLTPNEASEFHQILIDHKNELINNHERIAKEIIDKVSKKK